LSKRVVIRELSVDLEKGRGAERPAQLKAMEAEVSRLQLARTWGDMAGIMRGHEAMSALS
jgi:hypothetical protein